ncbi:uncharacterized protein JCM6883_000646 [Sporobolomyces salmoneus]|uniref:uncharacterized protein n=1 Tax=Sporobolomyces salmoneus TaxID=183962 RepID=UPI0031741051
MDCATSPPTASSSTSTPPLPLPFIPPLPSTYPAILPPLPSPGPSNYLHPLPSPPSGSPRVTKRIPKPRQFFDSHDSSSYPPSASTSSPTFYPDTPLSVPLSLSNPSPPTLSSRPRRNAKRPRYLDEVDYASLQAPTYDDNDEYIAPTLKRASGGNGRKAKKARREGDDEFGAKMKEAQKEAGKGSLWIENNMSEGEYNASSGYSYATGAGLAEKLIGSPQVRDRVKSRKYLESLVSTLKFPESSTKVSPIDSEGEMKAIREIVSGLGREEIEEEHFIKRAHVENVAITLAFNYATYDDDEKTLTMQMVMQGTGHPINYGAQMYDLHRHRSKNRESPSSHPYLLSSNAGIDHVLASALYDDAHSRNQNLLLDRCVPPRGHTHLVVAFGAPQAKQVDEFLASLPSRAMREKGRRIGIVEEEITIEYADFVKKQKIIKGGVSQVRVYKIEDLALGQYVSMILKTAHPSSFVYNTYELGQATIQDSIYGFLGDLINLIPPPLDSTPEVATNAVLPSASTRPTSSNTLAMASSSALPLPTLDSLPPLPSVEVAPVPIGSASLPPPTIASSHKRRRADACNSRHDAHAGSFEISSDSIFAPFLSTTRGSRVAAVQSAGGKGAVNPMTIRGDDGELIIPKRRRNEKHPVPDGRVLDGYEIVTYNMREKKFDLPDGREVDGFEKRTYDMREKKFELPDGQKVDTYEKTTYDMRQRKVELPDGRKVDGFGKKTYDMREKQIELPNGEKVDGYGEIVYNRREKKTSVLGIEVDDFTAAARTATKTKKHRDYFDLVWILYEQRAKYTKDGVIKWYDFLAAMETEGKVKLDYDKFEKRKREGKSKLSAPNDFVKRLKERARKLVAQGQLPEWDRL